MIDASLDQFDELPSCSVAESISRQSLTINAAMAQEIYTLLWHLMSGKLQYSGRFVNLDTGVSVPIRMRTSEYKKLGYRISKPRGFTSEYLSI